MAEILFKYLSTLMILISYTLLELMFFKITEHWPRSAVASSLLVNTNTALLRNKTAKTHIQFMIEVIFYIMLLRGYQRVDPPSTSSVWPVT